MPITCAGCTLTATIMPAISDKAMIYLAQIDMLYQLIMAGMIMMMIAGLGYGLILSARRAEQGKAAAQSTTQPTESIKAPVDPE